MDKRSLSERDICTQFITPAVVAAGWDVGLQVREEVSFTKGRIIVRGRLVTRGQPKRADYVLYFKPNTRVDLVRLRQTQRNRLAAPGADIVASVLRAVVRAIDKQLRALEARIAACLRRNPALSRDLAVLRGMRRIGDVTAAALLALMPELGALSGRAAVSLAGVAPHPHESGQRSGYRKTRGGRPDVKRTLFMAALVASQGQGAMAEAYRALVARGKKPIVALTALMRKLVVIANAKLRDARAGEALQVS